MRLTGPPSFWTLPSRSSQSTFQIASGLVTVFSVSLLGKVVSTSIICTLWLPGVLFNQDSAVLPGEQVATFKRNVSDLVNFFCWVCNELLSLSSRLWSNLYVPDPTLWLLLPFPSWIRLYKDSEAIPNLRFLNHKIKRNIQVWLGVKNDIYLG